MSDIYFPIDSTNLRYQISSRENIIYSTMMKGSFVAAGNMSTKFQSHILMTEKGFYWQIPKKRRQPDSYFTEWSRIKIITRGMIGFRSGIGIGTGNLKLMRIAQFETQENFKKRKKEFAFKIYPYIIKLHSTWLAENENNPSTAKRQIYFIRKKLAKAQRRFEKAKKKNEV